ncbi:hypothetical protein [Streptomyces sp. Da 82-17]|uniref:hypothetical protein n=1 Tax=Streptomyces sp. Da 82-17 TaxID=3377116 RepID=UPI0038D3FFE4
MTTTVWLREPAAKNEKAGPYDQRDGGVRRRIHIAAAGTEARAQSEPYAFPERTLPPGGVEQYRAARAEGTRSFTLWADRYRQQALAHVVTKSASKGGTSTYEILGAAGEPLAVVMREKAFDNGTRTRWTVQQTGGPAVVGHKGQVFGWVVWWLILPLQVLIAVGGLLGGGGPGAQMPYRTKWDLDGQTVLDWNGGHLHVKADWWDPRVTAALVALLKSHDGALGDSWDDKKD